MQPPDVQALLDTLEQAQARTSRLLEIAEDLSGATTVADVVDAIGAFGERMVGADWSAVAMLSSDGIELIAGRNEPGWVTSARSQWPHDAATPSAEVARTGVPAFLPSRETALARYPDPRFAEFVDVTPENAWAVLPLIGRSGTLGVLRLGFADEQQFDAGQRGYLRAIGQQCAVALERALLFEQQRTAAVSLASGLVPTRLPGVDGVELGVRYWPHATEFSVGGDWYDVFVLPGGDVALAVGDVMGHGLSAASGMGQLRAALRALALADADPGAVLSGLDRLVAEGGPVEFATVVYAVLDPRTGAARFGDAGHLPVLHLPADGPSALVAPDPPTTPIGVAERRFAQTMQLGRGDVVLGFTDGLVESRDLPLEEGLAALTEVATAVKDEPLDGILDEVAARLRAREGSDDLTILGLRWTGA